MRKVFPAKLLFSFVAIAGVALALTACGGSKKAEPTATAGSGGGSGSPAATATTASGGGATATPGGGAAQVGKLADLNSYRYTIKIDGAGGLLGAGVPGAANAALEMKGAYVKPDRGEYTITIGGQVLTTTTTIARQQWAAFAGITAPPTTLTNPTHSDYSLLADFWDDTLNIGDFTCASGRETVNGVSTRKCTAKEAFAREALGGIDQLTLGTVSRASAEVWISDNGYPVKSLVEIGGTSSGTSYTMKVEVNVTDINSNITINQPR